MGKKRLQLRSAVAKQTTLSVDREAGVIKGVSVITIGEAKGHGFGIDAVSLAQVASAINNAEVPVKSRLTHAEVEKVDSIRVLAGRFSNARVDGDRVIADFHAGSYAAHSPSGNLREYLLGLAEDAPQDCGVSIMAAPDDFDIEYHGGKPVFRLTGRLSSIDWVGDPAANPSGMLSACDPCCAPCIYDPLQGNGMNDSQIQYLRAQGLPWEATEEQTVAFIEALSDDQKNQLKALATSSAITDAIESATQGAAMSAKPNTPNGSAAAGTSAEGAAQQPAADATNPAQTPAEGVSLAAKPNATAAAAKGESVSLANLSELNDIAVLSDLGGDWAMKMAIEGVSLSEARKIALAEKAKKRAPVPMSGSGTVQVGEDLNLSTLATAISDAICLRAGIAVNAIPELDENRRAVMLSSDDGKRTMQTRKAHARASQFRHLSLCEMVRHQLIALGVKHSDALAMDNSRLAAIALSPNTFHRTLQKFGVALTASTSDFSSLLADSMGKTLRNAYSLATATWPAWCGRKTAKDFKTIRSVQLSEAPTLVSMPEGDEYEFGYLQDAGETTTLGSYGKGLKITRQAIINDDTDAFSRAASSMGRAALRLEESTAYAILTANAVLSDSVALFATAHANLTTGTLTVDNIGAAIAKMLAQVPLGGSTGQTIDVNAFTLVVPTSKWVLANKIINSPVDPALYNNTPNPLNAYPIQVVHSPILEASSAIIWYLFANPAQAECVNLWLLEGQEGPRINEEVEFTTDAMMMTVGHDVTAKAVEYRHGVRSSGS